MAIHEFGKDLEAQVGKLQLLAVLAFSAYTSGLFMIVTQRPVGPEAMLPVGASGNHIIAMHVCSHASTCLIVVCDSDVLGCGNSNTAAQLSQLVIC